MQVNQNVFWSQKLQKYLTYEPHCFLQDIENLMSMLKIQKKTLKKIDGFLDSVISIGNGKFSLVLREYS